MSIEISAVYSTYNRADYLACSLKSLLEQTLPKDNFEVIIVDDGSDDNTQNIISEFKNKLPIKSIYQNHKGLAAGKNNAVKNAESPFIVFMDDDDIATPNLLMEHLITNKETNANTAVLGKTDVSEEFDNDPLMFFVTKVGCHLFSYPSLVENKLYDYSYFWGGRSSCKKSTLVEYGFFDEEFTFGCEDIELGYRLSNSIDFTVIYHPKALTKMVRKISYEDFCKRCFNQGVSNGLFYKKHHTPEIGIWTQKPDFDKNWKELKKRSENIKKIGYDIDHIVRNRLDQSLIPDEFLLSLLYRSYWNAFDYHRMLGSSKTWLNWND